MKSLNFLLSIILLFCFFSPTIAQDVEESELQSVMMLSFTKYVQWPESAGDELIIGVYGDEDTYSFLEKKFNGVERYGRKLSIRNVSVNEEILHCNLLYLGKKGEADFDRIVRLIDGKQILLVTNDAELAEKGSCINFKSIKGKMGFELNKEALSKSRLRVSTQLANLATAI